MVRKYVNWMACLAVMLGLAAPASAIDPKFLPPNAEAAITINLKQILESDLLKDKKDLVDQGKEFLKSKLEESPAKEYLDKAGFDLFRDLHSITVTTDGSKDPDAMFIAIEGKFDPEKLVQVAKDAAAAGGEKLKVTKVGNVNVFEITPKDNEKTIYAGLINDSLMVAAPTREGLNATIARVSGGRTGAIKPGLKKLLETTNAKQSISIVATGDGLATGAKNAPKQPGGDFGAMLQNLDGLSFSITLTKDITFQLAGTAKDDENAKKMAAGLNFGLIGVRGMIVQKAQDDAKLQPVADIANTLRITTQETNVILRGEITQANLDRLLALIPR